MKVDIQAFFDGTHYLLHHIIDFLRFGITDILDLKDMIRIEAYISPALTTFKTGGK